MLPIYIKDGGQKGASKSHVRPALVVGEVMMAVVAVVGASQMVRGFRVIFDVYQGFSPDGVLTMRVALPVQGYDTPKKASGYFDQALSSIATLPAIDAVAASSNLPGALHFNPNTEMRIEGRPLLSPAERPSVNVQYVSAEFFQTLRIPVRAGRVFSARDGDDAPLVAAISEGMAAWYWPGEDPIGKRIRLHVLSHDQWRTIVGVVGDVNQLWFQKEPRPLAYIPYQQAPQRAMYLAIRTRGDPMSTLPAVRDRLRAIDAGLPLHEPRLMPKLMEETLSALSMTVGMMMIFGILAMLLAAVGVYGVMAYAVTQRTREFGIRIALGAQPRAVLQGVLRDGLALAAWGGVLGIAGGFALSRLMAGIMYGVSPTSFVILGGVPALLCAVSLIACWAPARSVTRLDPAMTLRQE